MAMPRKHKKDRWISIRVPASLYDALMALAEKDQRPLSQYARLVLDAHASAALSTKN